MPPQGDYFPDHERRILWILIPKCATTTLDVVLGADAGRVDRSEAERYADYFTVVFVRHPWRRLLSALYTVLDTHELEFEERIKRHILDPWPDVNMHVRPMHTFTDGFRLDFVGDVDNMTSAWHQLGLELALQRAPSGEWIWPDLKHENRHFYPTDMLMGFDWSVLDGMYDEDFALYARRHRKEFGT